RTRGGVGYSGDGGVRVHDAQFVDFDGGESAVCDGARRSFFSRYRVDSPAASDFFRGDCVSSDGGMLACADGTIRGFVLAGRFCAVDFLCAGGCLGVRLAAQGAGVGSTLPHVGISGGAGDLRVRSGCAYGESVAAAAGTVDDWIGADSRRAAVLPLLEKSNLDDARCVRINEDCDELVGL